MVEWENCGNTPTKNLEISVYLDSMNRPVSDDHVFPDYAMAKRVPIDIPPHRKTETGPLDMPISDMTMLQKGLEHCYIYGFAKYHDVLPGTPTHITEFCVKVTQVVGDLTDIGINKTIMVHYINHSKNNCYDEECDKQ
jgi:hypothetical protein